MNAGNRESSYAKSSNLQKHIMLRSGKVIEDTVEDYGINGFPECFKLADLGCSSGPNTFLLIENIVKSVHAACQKKNLKAPNEFQVFLNDLPNSDFNQLFKMTLPFYSKLENEKSVNCFISGVPGSFYTRLFPSKSLHFVHSSSSVHWLSRVPDKLLDNNQKNIHLAKSSPHGVYEAYFNQFKRDFTEFLRMRSEEIIPDGRMVLTLVGRSFEDHTIKDGFYIFALLAKSLQDMLVKGLLNNEEDINSFNLPLYTPCTAELKAIIESESSFSLDRLETFEVNWNLCSTEDEIMKSENSIVKFIAKTIRAATEPMLASHFGSCYMDQIFERYAMHITEHLSSQKIDNIFNIVVSLKRK